MSSAETSIAEPEADDEIVRSDAKESTAYIDRIEEVEEGEDKAVLYIGDDTDDMIKIVLPISLLPDDAAEGDYVKLTITIDNADDDRAATAEE